MEWHWLALIDEIGGIPLDLTTGALLRGNPIAICIKVQQVGAGLDLRNGIVSHRRYSIDSFYSLLYSAGGPMSREKRQRINLR